MKIRIVALGSAEPVDANGFRNFRFDPETEQATKDMLKNLKGCRAMLVIPTDNGPEGEFDVVSHDYVGLCGLAIMEN